MGSAICNSVYSLDFSNPETWTAAGIPVQFLNCCPVRMPWFAAILMGECLSHITGKSTIKLSDFLYLDIFSLPSFLMSISLPATLERFHSTMVLNWYHTSSQGKKQLVKWIWQRSNLQISQVETGAECTKPNISGQGWIWCDDSYGSVQERLYKDSCRIANKSMDQNFTTAPLHAFLNVSFVDSSLVVTPPASHTLLLWLFVCLSNGPSNITVESREARLICFLKINQAIQWFFFL